MKRVRPQFRLPRKDQDTSADARVCTLTTLLLWGGVASAFAGPEGMAVRQGQATATGTPNNLHITVSDRALIEWQKFNIAPNGSVTFAQPSASSIVWNKILDANPSAIYGNLQANGIVVLQNPSGFFFGPNSFVSAVGLFVTTTPSLPPDFSPGGMWMFNGPPPNASIVNYGQIRTETGGSLFLIAERIANHGTLEAPGGKVGLLAGEEILVSERPDGRGLSAAVRLPKGVVDNTGKIVADAGEISLHARVVNQGGVIEANSVRERNGVIELIASEQVNLSAASLLSARGSEGAAEAGGEIVVKSERSFSDKPGSQLNVSGGGKGGAGGFVEISAPEISAVNSTVIGTAQPGFAGGRLLLDPTDIIIGGTGTGAIDGTVEAGDPPTTLRLNVNTAFVGLSQITLEATRDIDLSANILWNLNESTGTSEPGSLLTLRAGRNLTLRAGASIVGEENWSLQLIAGADFQNGGLPVAGLGNVLLLGPADIQTKDGSISIAAGRDITVQTGAIRTIGGGDISVQALAGSVNTGTSREGFFWESGGGYRVNPASLGGISTAAGGDVVISAGKDVSSLLLTGSGSHADAGSGAFGEAPGDVTITAGENVLGHYVLRNGRGTIVAGKDAGTQARQLALSLIKGGWEVGAGNDILLQEVRNPNGIFNSKPFASTGKRHEFDYDPAASVKLKAENSVQLLGGAVPRNPSENIPSIYPPVLSIEAGPGDVIIGSDLYLFPSELGNLSIKTTGGGDLRSAQAGTVYEFGMSDSSKRKWSSVEDFRSGDPDHVLLHQHSRDPVRFEISGDVSDLSFFIPKIADMRVAGDLRNTSLIAQNFRETDTTRIIVGGDIFNRNDWTFAFPEVPPFMRALAIAVEPPDSLINFGILRQKFVFNDKTGRLGFQGRMSAGELSALLTLQVRTFDSLGQPIRDAQGNFVTEPGSLVAESVLRDIYERSQDVPNNAAQGYQVGGPGRIEVTANNMDLGITEGIVSHGPGANPLLAAYSGKGADIDVVVRGNLSMFSSSIQSRAGGDIKVVAGGIIDVGSQEILASSEVARGIYAAREGDVSVVARGNINVNGSRIAAYSGGDVVVRSLEGDVDAGEGGVGFVRVERVEVDPRRGVRLTKRGIPGSGILATTFPGTEGTVGDITIETPQGDIRAGQGGVAQLSFNGSPNKTGKVTLSAGTEGTPETEEIQGSILASNSGVIGGNIELRATGNIEGIVVAQGDLEISSKRDVTVTALASGNVSINASGNVAGTIVGVGSVDAQGGNISADVISANANVSSASGPSAADGVAATPAQAAAAAAADTTESNLEEDEEKKRKKQESAPMLARLQGRVTVILPGETRQ